MDPSILQVIAYAILDLSVALLCIFSLNNLILLCYSKLRSRKGGFSGSADLGALEWPFVTIQVATYNEGRVVARLLDSCLKLDYPPDKFEVIIVDDSTDETIDLLRDYEKRYYPKIKVIHRSERRGYKAGALNEALKYSKGEFILVLDADSVLKPDFLKKTIPQFLLNERLGFVQGGVKYLNEDESWLTRVLALANNWFAMFMQKMLSDCGMIMGFIGHGGVIRRRALEDVGGWMSDTLSEDMDIAYRIQLRGWEAKFIEDAISLEEVPPSYYSAAIRFKRHFKGTIQNLIKHWRAIVKHRGLSFAVKAEAIIQLAYPLVYLLSLLSLTSSALIYTLTPGALVDKFWFSQIGFLFSLTLMLFFPYIALIISFIPSVLIISAALLLTYILSLTGRVKISKIDFMRIFGVMLVLNDNIINFLTPMAEIIAGKGGEWIPTERAVRRWISGRSYQLNRRLREAVLRIIASLIIAAILVNNIFLNFSLDAFGLLIPAALWLCSAYLLIRG